VETLLHSISTEREAREFTWIGIRWIWQTLCDGRNSKTSRDHRILDIEGKSVNGSQNWICDTISGEIWHLRKGWLLRKTPLIFERVWSPEIGQYRGRFWIFSGNALGPKHSLETPIWNLEFILHRAHPCRDRSKCTTWRYLCHLSG
jgi:hypothetical protein